MNHARHATRTRRFWFGRVTLVVAGLLAASGGTAWAYFTATSSGTGAALAGKIAAPTTFATSGVTTGSVTLTWVAPSTPPPTGYELTQSPGTLATCSATPAATATSCTATTLTPGTTYTWTIQARYDTWLSTPVTTSAKTLVAPPRLVGVGIPTTWATHTSPSTKPVAYPTGLSTNDLLVLIIARSHNNTVACPTGWTTRASVTAHTGAPHAFLGVCSLLYTGGTHVTVTLTGTSLRGVSAEIAAFSHVTPITPFDGTAATSSSAAGAGTFSASGITTTVTRDLALSVVMENPVTTTIPTLTLSAAQGFSATTSVGIATTTSNAIAFATKTITTPGAVSFPTWTSTHTGLWVGASLALKPDPPSGSPPQAAHVQSASTSSTSAAASVTVTLPVSPTAGDALSLSVVLPPGGATVSTVSGGGVTWQKAVATPASSSGGDAEVWEGTASTGGTGTVTVTFSTNTPVVLASLSEWRGVATLGATAQASGTSATLGAGTLGTASDDLVVSAAVTSSASGAVSVDAPFAATSSTGTVSGFSAANTVAGPSTITWSTSGTGSWEAVAAIFAPAG